jgi:hypothetical protein
VLEVIIHSLFFHEALHEIEIALTVLHAVVALAVGLRQPVLEVRVPVLAKDFLDDVGRARGLKDAAIRRARQEPQPGCAARAIGDVGSEAPGLRELDDECMEVAGAAVIERNVDACFLAQQFVEVDVLVGTQQVDLDRERLAQLFPDRRRAYQQLVTI